MPSVDEINAYLAEFGLEDTMSTAVKELIKAGMPVNPILYLGNYFMRMATEPPVYEHTEEAKKLMADRGWDQGYVVFGHGPSESTVKLLTTVCLVKGTDFKHVDVSFDDTVLGEEDKMGVKSEAFKLLTAGVSKMPALAIDGVMYYESELICRKLAVDTGAPSEVIELIDLSIASSERMLNAAKHWAWSGLHKSMDYAMVNKEHYSDFGKGLKSEAWEKETGKVIETFLATLEAKLAARPSINGYFVGDALTIADCVLINWYLTFSSIMGLDVDGRYPKFAENWKALKESAPAGAQWHYEHFPGFGDYCAGANKELREGGFDINKVMP